MRPYDAVYILAGIGGAAVYDVGRFLVTIRDMRRPRPGIGNQLSFVQRSVEAMGQSPRSTAWVRFTSLTSHHVDSLRFLQDLF